LPRVTIPANNAWLPGRSPQHAVGGPSFKQQETGFMYGMERSIRGSRQVRPLAGPVRRSLLASALALAAGNGTAAPVTGRMVAEDSHGQLRGGSVTIVELGRQAITDRDGRFQFHGVPTGTYTIEARYAGHETRRLTVQVQEGRPVRADVALAPAYTE